MHSISSNRNDIVHYGKIIELCFLISVGTLHHLILVFTVCYCPISGRQGKILNSFLELSRHLKALTSLLSVC